MFHELWRNIWCMFVKYFLQHHGICHFFCLDPATVIIPDIEIESVHHQATTIRLSLKLPKLATKEWWSLLLTHSQHLVHLCSNIMASAIAHVSVSLESYRSLYLTLLRTCWWPILFLYSRLEISEELSLSILLPLSPPPSPSFPPPLFPLPNVVILSLQDSGLWGLSLGTNWMTGNVIFLK